MKANKGLCRILDANANRCREGLRVIEEIARFVIDDKGLTKKLKYARHHLNSSLIILEKKCQVKLICHRDSANDVGSRVTLMTERRRGDLFEVSSANFKRLEEGLRVLEEFSKLADSRASDAFKALRYRAYTLEKEVHLILRKKTNKMRRWTD